MVGEQPTWDSPLFGSFPMLFNFYLLNLFKKTCIALVNLWWSINKIWIEKWTFIDYRKCILIEYVYPLSSCVHYRVQSS